jgi:Flp pilus assembly pilin Flp
MLCAPPGGSRGSAAKGHGIHFWMRPPRRPTLQRIIHNVRSSQTGQGITEYVVMLTMILVLVMGTLRLVGVNAKNALSKAANALQHRSDGD